MEGVSGKVMHLSVIDQIMIRRYVHIIWCFPFPDHSKASLAADRLRCGLQTTLSHWPFLAGAVGAAEHDSKKNILQLRYGEKVADVTNSGRFCIKDLTDKRVFPFTYTQLRESGMPASALDSHVLSSLSYGGELFTPVMGVQANFITGGLLLCLTFDHTVMDGVSMQLCTEDFAKSTRLCLPVENDVVDGLSQPRKAISDQTHPEESNSACCPEYNFRNTSIPSSAENTISRIFVIPAARVSALKKEVTLHLNNENVDSWVSASDCLCAVLWASVIRIRSQRLASSAQSGFSFPVNARSNFDPPLAADYFGNAIVTTMVTSTVGQLTGAIPTVDENPSPESSLSISTIVTAASEIRKTILKIDNKYVQERLNLYGSLHDPSVTPTALARKLDMTNSGLFLSSWIDFGADADFGIPGATTGCAEWIRKPWGPSEGACNILPRRSSTKGDADWELLVALSADDMEKLSSDKELGGWASRVIE